MAEVGAGRRVLGAGKSEPKLMWAIEGECVLRYDNESGKGDHSHMGGNEATYVFVSVDHLLDDFLADVARWKGQ